MSLFEQMADQGYGELHLGHDHGAGLRAIVAIHDVRLGPALGGCRCVHYTSEEAAIADALRLAKAMTYKAALAGLGHGGGKSVIMLPPGEVDREALFRAFGRFVDLLGGRYITTEDSGTSIADMEVVRGVTRHVTGFDRAHGGSGDPSPFTALGVRRGIEACVELVLQRDLKGLHVVVKGVGNVGSHLCRELAEAGARLTLADVNAAKLAAVAQRWGAQTVPVEQAHRVECDVFAPCALGGELDERTIPELRCRIVAGAANNQLAADHHGQALVERGIVYAPDYAINAGGLINVAQEVTGYDEAKARERTLAIHDTVATIVSRALQEKRPPHEIADGLVQEHLAKS